MVQHNLPVDFIGAGIKYIKQDTLSVGIQHLENPATYSINVFQAMLNVRRVS